MALTAMELIPALSPFRVGTGGMTAEIFGALEILARAILPTTTASGLAGDLSETAVAYIILHLYESRSGDLDKSSVNAMGYSYSRNGNVPPQKTSYWLAMEHLATLATEVTKMRGAMVQRGDVSNVDFRIDNAPMTPYPTTDDTYTGG